LNAIEIEEAITLLAEQPFYAESFPFVFLEAFGNYYISTTSHIKIPTELYKSIK